jgi:pantetheine-phosphate adenylyltransferase
LADFVVNHGANVIVRGARCATDFDVEYQLALINRSIYPELDTVIFPASAEYQHFSSSMAREMIRYRQPLEKYLPEVIVPVVREIFEGKGE